MSKKALYKHKKTGDLFAIETDERGNVISTSGPLLVKDLNPNELDYDNYWDKDIKAHLNEFVLLLTPILTGLDFAVDPKM